MFLPLQFIVGRGRSLSFPSVPFLSLPFPFFPFRSLSFRVGFSSFNILKFRNWSEKRISAQKSRKQGGNNGRFNR
jgi:hypothetical protein